MSADDAARKTAERRETIMTECRADLDKMVSTALPEAIQRCKNSFTITLTNSVYYLHAPSTQAVIQAVKKELEELRYTVSVTSLSGNGKKYKFTVSWFNENQTVL